MPGNQVAILSIVSALRQLNHVQFQMQHPSVAIHRSNAVCIVGTVPFSAGWDKLFYISLDKFTFVFKF